MASTTFSFFSHTQYASCPLYSAPQNASFHCGYRQKKKSRRMKCTSISPHVSEPRFSALGANHWKTCGLRAPHLPYVPMVVGALILLQLDFRKLMIPSHVKWS